MREGVEVLREVEDFFGGGVKILSYGFKVFKESVGVCGSGGALEGQVEVLGGLDDDGFEGKGISWLKNKKENRRLREYKYMESEGFEGEGRTKVIMRRSAMWAPVGKDKT